MSPDNLIGDDPSLLALLMKDQDENGGIFEASDYWRSYSRRIAGELARSGLSGFRRNARISKGYVDVIQRNPMDTVARSAKSWHLYRIISAIPGVRSKILKRFDLAIAAAQDDAVHHRAAFLRLKDAALFAKHQVVLENLNSTVGFPEAVTNLDGVETSLHYLDLLARVENFSASIDFSQMETMIEIGGGFGSNAHLLLALNPKIKKYLYVDIPPMLYVGTQYLQSLFGDEVATYRDWKNAPTSDLADFPHRIVCLPPWCLQEAQFPWDGAWNSASFQEMTSDQMSFYVDYLQMNSRSVNSALALIYYEDENRSMRLNKFLDEFSGKMEVGPIAADLAYSIPSMKYFVARPQGTTAPDRPSVCRL